MDQDALKRIPGELNAHHYPPPTVRERKEVQHVLCVPKSLSSAIVLLSSEGVLMLSPPIAFYNEVVKIYTLWLPAINI